MASAVPLPHETELRPSTIVEVGSFLGCSSRHFAGLLKAANLDSVVVCVDTWLAEEVLYGEDQKVSPLSSYFELMDRLLPNFLGVISPQKIRGTRVLLK